MLLCLSLLLPDDWRDRQTDRKNRYMDLKRWMDRRKERRNRGRERGKMGGKEKERKRKVRWENRWLEGGKEEGMDAVKESWR